MKDARFREEEERRNLDEKLKSGPQTRGEIEAEYEQLQKTKIEIENEYQYAKREHKRQLEGADQMYHEINQYAIETKRERDRKRIQLKKLEADLVVMKKTEENLDAQLEKILGYAVDMSRLEWLYQQDLKALNAIERGLNNKIDGFIDLIAALKVNKQWKAFMFRQRLKRQMDQKAALRAKNRDDEDRANENRALRAAIVI